MDLPVIPEAEALAEVLRDLPHRHGVTRLFCGVWLG
jgi:hypothetical protein